MLVVEERDELKRKFQADESQLKKLNTKLNELKEEISLREKLTQGSNTKLNSLQEHVRTFKDILDRILLQLSAIKQLTITLKQERDEIELERDSLKHRGAVAFDELTPRPNYDKIQKERRVDFQIRPKGKFFSMYQLLTHPLGSKEGKDRVQISTCQAFDAMVHRYQELLKQKHELEAELREARQLESIPPSATLTKRPSTILRPPRLSVQVSSRNSPAASPRNTSKKQEFGGLLKIAVLAAGDENNSWVSPQKKKSIFGKLPFGDGNSIIEPKSPDRISPGKDSEVSFDFREVSQQQPQSEAEFVKFTKQNSLYSAADSISDDQRRRSQVYASIEDTTRHLNEEQKQSPQEQSGQIAEQQQSENQKTSDSLKSLRSLPALFLNLPDALGIKNKSDPLSENIIRASEELVKEISETKNVINQIVKNNSVLL